MFTCATAFCKFNEKSETKYQSFADDAKRFFFLFVSLYVNLGEAVKETKREHQKNLIMLTQGWSSNKKSDKDTFFEFWRKNNLSVIEKKVDVL